MTATSAKPVAFPGVRIAPFALLRVAALPAGPLLALAPAETTRAVSAAVTAGGRVRRLAPRLEDELHQVVPLLPTDHRRLALDVRRRVHNDRTAPDDEDRVDALAAVLPPPTQSLLDRWWHAARDRAGHLREAEERYDAELTALRSTLHVLAADEAFRRPLALASAQLSAELRRPCGTGRGTAATRRERSVLRYLARAAVKTSPFSVFLHHALVEVGVEPAGPALDPRDRTSRVTIDRGVLGALQRAAQLAGPAARCLALNPSLQWHDNGLATFLRSGDPQVSDGTPRRGRYATVRLHTAIVAALAQLPNRFSARELAEALTGAGMAATEAFADRLQARGLVVPAPFSSGHDPHPEGGLLDVLNDGGPEVLQAMRDTVTALVGHARELADANSARRAEVLGAASRRLHGVPVVSPGLPRPEADLFREDGYFRHPASGTGPVLADMVRELGTALRARTVVTAPYFALRQLFVADYGARGRCDDVLGFLVRAATVLHRGDWYSEDAIRGETAPPAGTPVRVSVLAQFAASNAEALAQGRGLVVLNDAAPGLGWLTARHAVGDSRFHRDLRNGMRRWLQAAYAPDEPVDVMLFGHHSSLQAHPPLTARTLCWPTEPTVRSGTLTLPLDDTALHLDASTGLLRLVDQTGARLAPVYLGGAVPHPGWGPEFWLVTLTWPHRVTWSTEAVRPPTESAEVVALPRRSEGRVVLDRAAWWMTSERLRRTWFARNGAARLFDVAADCDAHALPRRVFVRSAGGTEMALDPSRRKPLWADLANPFCLDTLCPLLDRTSWLLFTEALPSTPVWPRVGTLPHTSELLVEMVL